LGAAPKPKGAEYAAPEGKGRGAEEGARGAAGGAIPAPPIKILRAPSGPIGAVKVNCEIKLF